MGWSVYGENLAKGENEEKWVSLSVLKVLVEVSEEKHVC